MMRKPVFLLTSVLFILLMPALCLADSSNPVLAYLRDAELQYEGEEQKENIRIALQDMITLDEKELAKRRYKDYQGQPDQWDLPTLIYRHFVPGGKVNSLGNNFFRDVTSDEVRRILQKFLKRLK
jgi:hypothetical protein